MSSRFPSPVARFHRIHSLGQSLQVPARYQAPCLDKKSITIPMQEDGASAYQQRREAWDPTKKGDHSSGARGGERKSNERLGVRLRSCDSVLLKEVKQDIDKTLGQAHICGKNKGVVQVEKFMIWRASLTP